jgi:diadenosine tetraphosphate (Ap4A) HIT family hydrolase
MTPNSTQLKFGYPDSRIRDFDHWSVLLRPQQNTLGSLIIVTRSEATNFGDLAPAAFSELATVVANSESALRKHFDYTKINYLMLMMVDPHVHFHVFPRYDSPRKFASKEFKDLSWPKPPDLSNEIVLEFNEREDLRAMLINAFTR